MSERSTPRLVLILAVVAVPVGILAWTLGGGLGGPASAPGGPGAAQEGEPGTLAPALGSGAVDSPAAVGVAGERSSAGDAASGREARALRLVGRVDPGLAALDPGRAFVALFDRPLTEADLFAWDDDSDEPSMLAEADAPPAGTLEPARYGLERELDRLGAKARVEVDADGAFELELEPTPGVLHLAVVGDLLATQGTVAVRPEEFDSEIVLRARAGCLIEGRLRPDPALGQLELSRFAVGIEPMLTGGFDPMIHQPDLLVRRAEVLADGRFRLRAHPLTGTGLVSAEGAGAAPATAEIELAPGRRLTLDLPLRRGALIAGRILAPDGTPVSGALVEVGAYGGKERDATDARRVESDSRGRFSVDHVEPGRLELMIRADDFAVRRIRIEEPLRDGERREDLIARLEAGQRLAGVVRRLDGAPAAGAEIELRVSDSAQFGLRSLGSRDTGARPVVTDAAGEFELRGLSETTFDVTGRLVEPDGTVLVGWANEVEPGGAPMELLLSGATTFEGRVSGEDGRGIAEFSLALRMGAAGESLASLGLGQRIESRRFFGTSDGSFRVAELPPGRWQVLASAPGHASSEWRELDLPTDQPQEFVLGPAAVLEGTVVGPAGAPVIGAQVELWDTVIGRIDRARFGLQRTAVTDSEGVFRLDGLDPGRHQFLARHPEWGVSQTIEEVFDSGERVRGALLQLEDVSRLTGEAYSPEGEPLRGAMIVLQRVPGNDSTRVGSTGDDGAFAFDRVSAGSYTLVVVEDRAERPTELGEVFAGLLLERVELLPGESEHVVLGLERALDADPVEVSGRVLHGGRPVPDAILNFIPPGGGVLRELKLVSCDAEGRYTVQLDRPGAYQVQVQLAGASGIASKNVSFAERVPERPSHQLDLELPLGRISGRVIGSDGEPAGHVHIALQRMEGARLGSLLGSSSIESQTAADGTFDLEFLRAGTYRLVVGGRMMVGFQNRSDAVARTMLEGIELAEGQWVADQELRLSPSCSLTGAVVDPSGEAVADADVYVRDAEGRLVDSFSTVQTSSAGRFEYTGLPPGRYRAEARSGELVSGPSEPVELTGEDDESVELRLDQGTRLVVVVTDQSGDVERSGFDVGAWVSVTDERGREYATMASMNDLVDAYGVGFQESEQVIGPLPAGSYSVTVQTDDGRRKRKSVDLLGQAERVLKVKLR